MIGVEPDMSHKKGDPNVKITKKGKIIEYSPFNAGVWSINTTENENIVLESHIQDELRCFKVIRRVKYFYWDMHISFGVVNTIPAITFAECYA